MQNIGFNQEQAYRCLMFAIIQKLIETEARKKPKSISDIPKSIRITTLGAYHLQKLICKFVYLDAIIIDTPILDDEFRKKLNNTDIITERLERVKLFNEYLDNSWQKIDSERCGFNWSKSSVRLKKNIESISSKLINEKKQHTANT